MATVALVEAVGFAEPLVITPPQWRGTGPRGISRRQSDRTGPLFLLLLIVIAFIPSVLGEFDRGNLSTVLRMAVAAKVPPSPLFTREAPPSRELDIFCSLPVVSDAPPSRIDGKVETPSVVLLSTSRGPSWSLRQGCCASSPRGPPPIAV